MNRSPYRTVTILILIAIGLMIPGCGARTASAPARPQVVLTLLDLSGSTGAVRDKYMAEVRRIVESVPPGARLVVLPVSSRSLTAPALADVSFPPYVWWKTNSFTHGREMKRLRAQAMAGVAAPAGQQSDGRGTAIIDSLLQAQEYLKPYPEGAGALYIISDMVEQSELLDLYGLEDAGVQPALARVKQARRMPDLRGAAVSVAGLEAGGHLPSARILAIKGFWESLFEEAGARLLWYSPTLQFP